MPGILKQQYPTPPVPLSEHPASLPEAIIDENADHAAIAAAVFPHLKDLRAEDLADNAIWRDTAALTGTFRTFFRPALVCAAWRERSSVRKVCELELRPGRSRVMTLGPRTSWIEADFDFRTGGRWPAYSSGTLGIVPSTSADGTASWKIWLLTTILEGIDGWPDVDFIPSRKVAGNGLGDDAVSHSREAGFPDHVDCLVAGGASGGLCMGGRLQALGISYLVVDKHPELGHSWLKDRYESLKLHTSRDFVQMPGQIRTFSPDEPYNMKSSLLVEGFKRYIDEYGINVRFSTSLEAAKWDATKKHWTLTLRHGEQDIHLTARHVVLAVGGDGVQPTYPDLPGRELYQGDVLHGGHWRNGEAWRGRAGIIVGSANTAQGVMGDMARAGFRGITMVQRSRTFLLPIRTFSGLVDPVFNPETPTARSDRMLHGYPLPIQRLAAMRGIRALADANADYFDRIEARGFDGERYGDLWGLMYGREGGHFFDLGSGELIANGTAQVRSKVAPVAYTPTGLRLSDGSTVDGDVIVWATGYKANMRDTARRIFGPEIGDGLQEFWHCDKEGEIRGAWKYIGHPGIWYTGHGVAHVRYYSRFVAMHIKADLEGDAFDVYAEMPDLGSEPAASG